MGWESRGSGRYFYRKRRMGGRVVSQYCGAGAIGQMAEETAILARKATELKRQRESDQIAEAKATDAPLVALDGLLRTLTVTMLERDGFHRHKGTWRRRRGG